MTSQPAHSTARPPILQLRRLSVGYHKPLLSLGDATINAHRGQAIALLGRNGCGKTTLLRTIAGLLSPLRGEVLTNGAPLAALTRRAKAQLVAFAPTRHTPESSIKVHELVMLARFPHQGWFKRTTEQDHRAVAHALELTETTPFARRSIGTLSDGERQRVWLAMALAQETPILLLDEPSAFLDFPAKGSLVKLLHTLSRATQRLIVYSTHDLQSALWHSDRLWILHQQTLYDSLPEVAAQEGALNDVFGTASSQFDPHSFTFTPTPSNEASRPHFWLANSAETPDTPYARRLLLRLGWQEAPCGGERIVTIQRAPDGCAWLLPHGARANSLEELARWAQEFQ